MKLTRFCSQAFFLALTLVGTFVLLANCEKWCPFGGVESLYTYITEGNMACSLGVSSFFILGSTLLGVLIARRAFCGYACPIGTISSWTRSIFKKLGLKEIRVTGKVDRALSLLKYPIVILILWLTWSASELLFRAACPAYALVGRNGEDITYWAYIVAGSIVFFSIFFMLPFCRWFCPLAAVLNPLSRIGFLRVKRNQEACVDCGACAKACPMAIPVDKMPQVNAARCISCFDCVSSCPKKVNALSWGPVTGGRWPTWTALGILLATIAIAATLWMVAPLPSFIKVREGFAVPEHTAQVDLKIDGLACRGSSNKLYFFLTRDDEVYKIPGYFKLEAWPDQIQGRAVITYDADKANDRMIKEAITQPYYEPVSKVWWNSTFTIEGFDPLDFDIEDLENIDDIGDLEKL